MVSCCAHAEHYCHVEMTWGVSKRSLLALLHLGRRVRRLRSTSRSLRGEECSPSTETRKPPSDLQALPRPSAPGLAVRSPPDWSLRTIGLPGTTGSPAITGNPSAFAPRGLCSASLSASPSSSARTRRAEGCCLARCSESRGGWHCVTRGEVAAAC